MTSAPPAVDADKFLRSVVGWIRLLAGRAARHHGIDPDDAEQAIAEQVVRRLHHYNPARSKPSTFVALVARGVVARLAEREARHRDLVSLDWPAADGEFLEVPGREPDPVDVAAVREQFAAAMLEVGRLPGPQRSAVLIRCGLTDGPSDSARAALGLARLQTRLRTQGE